MGEAPGMALVGLEVKRVGNCQEVGFSDGVGVFSASDGGLSVTLCVFVLVGFDDGVSVGTSVAKLEGTIRETLAV